MKTSLILLLNILLPLWTLHLLVCGMLTLFTPRSNSEFAAYGNAFKTTIALLLVVLSCVLLIVFVRFLRRKTKSVLPAFLLVVCAILLLAISDLPEWIFEISPGAALSLNHEILPVILLVLFIYTREQWNNRKP